MILLTGAGGMLGNYLYDEFKDHKVKTLGLKSESDFVCDLSKEVPDLKAQNFNTVIHAAGTEDDTQAMSLNLEGTKNLLEALKDSPPENFVYISSHRVYSKDAGMDITEDTNTWASDNTGKSKALAENLLREWCDKNNVTLTIIRPARMFGSGVKGETLSLFNDAITGKYIHIRGNDAMVSIVCAIDVARGIKKIYKLGGIYNAADNHPVRFIEMIEALTANYGSKKRMTHLPAAWAEWLWRIGRFIPSVERNLNPATVEARMISKTLNGKYFEDKTGISYHDTIAVIEHKDPDYPYKDLQTLKTHNHEV